MVLADHCWLVVLAVLTSCRGSRTWPIWTAQYHLHRFILWRCCKHLYIFMRSCWWVYLSPMELTEYTSSKALQISLESESLLIGSLTIHWRGVLSRVIQPSVEWRQLTGSLIYATVIVTVGYIAIVSTVKRRAAIISTGARQYKLEETPSGVHWIIFLTKDLPIISRRFRN